MGPLFVVAFWGLAGSALGFLAWLGFLYFQKVNGRPSDRAKAAALTLAMLAALAAYPALLLGYRTCRALIPGLVFKDAFGLPAGPEIRGLTGVASLPFADGREACLKFQATPEIVHGLALGMQQVRMQDLDLPGWDPRYSPTAPPPAGGTPWEVYRRTAEGGARSGLIYDPNTETAYYRCVETD